MLVKLGVTNQWAKQIQTNLYQAQQLVLNFLVTVTCLTAAWPELTVPAKPGSDHLLFYCSIKQSFPWPTCIHEVFVVELESFNTE